MRFKCSPALHATAAQAILAANLAFVCPGAMGGEPIPGVDIYLGKNPGGRVITLPTDEFGHFSLRLTEPGNYTLSTACKLPCAPHAITATYSGDANFGRSGGTAGSGPEPVIAILVGLLLPAVQKITNTPVATSFNVDQRGLVVSGQLPSTEGTYFIGSAGGGSWKTLAQINAQSPGAPKAAPKKAADGTLIWDTADGTDRLATQTPQEGMARALAIIARDGAVRRQERADIDHKNFLNTAVRSVSVGGREESLVRPGAGTPTGSVTFRNSEGLRIAENESPRPTNRTITVTPVNDAPGISDQGAAGNLTSYGTAPPPPAGSDGKAPGISLNFAEIKTDYSPTRPSTGGTTAISDADALYLKIKMQEILVSSTAKPSQGGNEPLPGLAGTPIQGIPIGLEGDPGQIKFNATTDAKGDFQFDKLPAGNYLLTLPGAQPLPLTVGADGLAGGNLIKGHEGNLLLFVRKAGEKPIEYVLQQEGPVNGIGGTGGGRLTAGGTNLGTTPVNGIGGTGGGRFTFKPTRQAGQVTAGSRTELETDKAAIARKPDTGFGSGNTPGIGVHMGGGGGAGMLPRGGPSPGSPMGPAAPMGGAGGPGGPGGGAMRR